MIFTLAVVIDERDDGLKAFIKSDAGELLLVPAIIMFVVSIAALLCCKQERRVCAKYVYAFAITLSTSYITGRFSANSDFYDVFMAGCLTIGVTIATTTFACYSNKPFDFETPIPFIFGFIIPIAGILALLF